MLRSESNRDTIITMLYDRNHLIALKFFYGAFFPTIRRTKAERNNNRLDHYRIN